MKTEDLVSGLQQSKYVDNAELEARWLIEHFTLEKTDHLIAAIERRKTGEPLAYILGEWEFFGLTFKVNSHVLIPRPETELLVETALGFINKQNRQLKVLDLGCGSGCVGLTLIKKAKNVDLTTVDISSEALDVAKQNAKSLALEDRVQFIHNDTKSFCLTTDEQFDVILSNPPYVDRDTIHQDRDALSFEPQVALYAKEGGFFSIEEWVKESVRLLKKPGLMAFEIGFDQGQKSQQLFESLSAFEQVSVLKDLAGHDRVVRGVRG